MNVLFEEDGAFKAATILTDQDTSLQVETAHGKRIKLKAANVLLRYNSPAASELLKLAEAEAANLDTEFLWEMCSDLEFAFADFAKEYYGHTPGAVEAVAVLLALQAAPIYFHRKGKGRFRKAPPEILQAALAAQEKKRQQQAAISDMSADLQAGKLPEGFAKILPQLLYRPDKNRLESKALDAACEASGLSVPRLLLKAGAFSSSHDYLLGRFLFEHFPQGAAHLDYELPQLDLDDLPVATVEAFSIDDASTTEIDDALSIQARPDGGWTIGVHIAAPALGIAQGSPLDQLARSRLSTVYMPGNKITMLPDALVEVFTLGAGSARPAVSLYTEVSADYVVLQQRSVIERVPVAANLRIHEIEALFNDDTVYSDNPPDFPFRADLTRLWEFACVLEAGRGKPSSNQNAADYNYHVDWAQSGSDGPGVISIERRRRGAPLDKLVAELMILANSSWGKLLHEAKIPAIYRAQGGGKVRMTTAAAPHEGLGVDCYAWSSSPLRRYVDLCNQWQLISHLQNAAPAFAPGSAQLAAAMHDFDTAYSAYAEFQRNMERYWCLRYLRQTGDDMLQAQVLRDNLVRLEAVPFIGKIASLPALPSGARVQLALQDIDLIDVELRAKYVATLDVASPAVHPSQDEAVETDGDAATDAAA